MNIAQSIDDELAELRRRHGVAGAGAALVTRDGTTIVRVAGTIHRDSSDPVTPTDQWHIGSCAKAMTAALYAQLVEADITSWDVPVGTLLSDLDAHPGWRTRTVAEALTCQAGIRRNPSWREIETAYRDSRPVSEQRRDAACRALAHPPRGPGRFRYSNMSYIVVGAIIDRLTGSPFENVLHERLLDPLGTTSTGFGPPPRIWGHTPWSGIGGLVVGRRAPAPPDSIRSDNPPVLTPAGRLHINLADWAKFHHLILCEGGELLTARTCSRLLTTPTNGRMAMGWAPSRQLDGVLVGMQGSNTMWSASALVAADRSSTAMVVANDGRTRVLTQTAHIAHRLLTHSRRAGAG